MYVQWVSRNRDRKDGGVLIAQLVESKRVDGKPRKRVRAHLGTCREPVDTLRHRFWFYERCDRVLDRLALAPNDRAKIETQLAVRIPRPSEEERALWQQEKAILIAAFGRSGGFAYVKGWNADNEEERRRFLDQLRKAEEVRAPVCPRHRSTVTVAAAGV
jgi:hypothetical protein